MSGSIAKCPMFYAYHTSSTILSNCNGPKNSAYITFGVDAYWYDWARVQGRSFSHRHEPLNQLIQEIGWRNIKVH